MWVRARDEYGYDVCTTYEEQYQHKILVTHGANRRNVRVRVFGYCFRLERIIGLKEYVIPNANATECHNVRHWIMGIGHYSSVVPL